MILSQSTGIPQGQTRITLICALFCCLALGCGPPDPLVDLSSGVPNVVLIGLDTVRADHLGCYGNRQIQTPVLDQFAEEAILFERCSSTSSWTLPAFASLFTSRMPYSHGAVGGERLALRSDLPTLASTLKAHGYTTRAYVAIDWLTEKFGLMRGVERLEEYVRGPVTGRLEFYQPELLRYLGQEPKQPFFLFAHYYDAHDPYWPPAPYQGMYYDGDPTAAAHESIDVIYGERSRIAGDPAERYQWLDGIRDLQFPVAEYAANVSYVDGALASVMDSLRSTNLFDESIVVVVADHGEHLTEHDLYFTHRFPYEECLRVPLLLRLPGGKLGGTRIEEEVSVLDIAPTLLELLGMREIESAEGLSLVPLMSGSERLGREYLFAEYGASEDLRVRAVWDRRYRLLDFVVGGRRWQELYDRREDPGELHDIAASAAGVRERLERKLDERYGSASDVVARPEEASTEIDAETRQRLRSLGYLE